MKKPTLQIILHLFSFAILLPFGLCVAVKAERLPFKIYSTTDGLANDNVNKIVPDSRGFLWFCTSDGLSRFDGNEFKNYTQDQGLPARNINDFFETKDGTYLVATSSGLAVFDPNGKAYRWNTLAERLEQTSSESPIFKTYYPPIAAKNILSLAQANDGSIYAGTDHGLFRFAKSGEDWQFNEVEFADWKDKIVEFNSLFPDSKQGFWLLTNIAIYRMSKEGEIEKINELGGNNIFEDRDGGIWIDGGGNTVGIRIYKFANGSDEPILSKIYTKKDGLPDDTFATAIAETSDGKIYAAANGTLCEFLKTADGDEPKFRRLLDEVVNTGSGAIDKNGNLWIGIAGKGAWKHSPDNFSIFDERDGIPNEILGPIFGSRNGDVFFTVGNKKIMRVGDEKFESVVPFGKVAGGRGDSFSAHQSNDDDWWIGAMDGLRHYPKVKNFNDLAQNPPIKIYTETDGLGGSDISIMFEDSRGDIWFCTGKNEIPLLRWEKKTETIHRYMISDEFPKLNKVVTFGEDASGNVWIGFYLGGLVRYKNEQFRSFSANDGFPEGSISDMMSDKEGRFWLSTASRGLFRIDDPDADTPVFTNLSTIDGLSTNQTFCLSEDNFGKIYIGTGHGINRLDPKTQKIKIYTPEDGLPNNYVPQCYADNSGVLWFTSNNSLIRFLPALEKPPSPPPIFIDAISINGIAKSISELGETEIKHLEFSSDERQIQISFFAISFDSGETLRYQYKLDGQDWSQPNEQRTISFNLSAGNYNFSVQAINSDGVASEKPATISFSILPPIYERWWFLLLATAFICLILFVIYRRRTANLRKINVALTEAKLAEEALSRSREERLKELQKVRSRIATDLHDDIGSSLTQITLFSELARQREHESGKAGEPLDMISNVASELVDTMSDIVWAINPSKDHLQDLTQRMRRFAANVLTAKDIEMTFSAPASDTDIPLGANIRREVFLIFKETVNNIVKHSEATNAKIAFSMKDRFLEINFKDNGKGFDQTGKESENESQDWKRFRGGNGLLNMKKRANDLGGEYEIKSEVGKGTTVILRVPLEINQESIEKATQTGDVLPKL